MPELSDNGNINIFNIGQEVFTTGETCFFRDLDPDTLKTTDKFDTNKYFGLQMACAHPLTDDAGYTYNVGCSLLTGLKYNIVKIPPIGKTESPKDAFKKSKIISTIPSSNSTYMGKSCSK
jgi:carotenoid cleavage dioxygenase-like enzyme